MRVCTRKELQVLSDNLNVSQRTFVLELVKCGNQRQAHIAAKGVLKNQTTQDSAASNMFNNVKVKAYYHALMEIASVKSCITREQAIERLSLSAKVSMTDVCSFNEVRTGQDDNGDDTFRAEVRFRNSDDIPDHVAACIKKIKTTKHGLEIELYSSTDSIKALADLCGWEPDKTVNVNATITKIVREII